WSELEIEHSFVEGGERSGEVALEQAYLDFLIKPYFNVRAGMVLTPVGILNERHEPPAFNGVERPFVETLIIPTTWRELGFGHTGFHTPGINPRVTIVDFDGRYSYRRFGLRGLFANSWVSRASELNRRLQLQTGRNPNIARELRGYYLEPAVHVWPARSRNDL